MNKKTQGFTLVELVIVLVLMIIIGAAVIPNMQMIYRQQIQKAANEMAMDLTMLRRQARATNKEYKLVLDASAHHYTMTSESTAIEAMHQKDVGNTENITFELYGDGTATNEIIFEGDLMKTAAGTEVEAYTIKVTYKDMSAYGQLTFKNVEGTYTFQMVS